jgi:hypothetical protein
MYRICISALALAGVLFASYGLSMEGGRLALAAAELDFVRKGAKDSSSAVDKARLASRASCRNDVRRADAALSLADLQTDDGADRTGLLANARASMQKLLSCSPGDGNAWLLLAIIDRELGNLQSAVDYVRLSQSDAPREGWIIERRIGFACSAAVSGFLSLSQVVRADLEALLNDRQFAQVASAYSGCKNPIAPVLEDALANVRPSVREGYAFEIARLSQPAP